MSFSKTNHNGEIIKSQRMGGFHLTEILYSPNYSIPRHLHQDPCFCFTFQGTYREVFREKTVEGNSSRLVFRPAGEAHSDHFGNQETSCLLIEFNQEWLEKFRHTPIKFQEPDSFQSNSLIWLAMKLHQEFHRPDDFTAFTIEGLMLEIIADIGRNSKKTAQTKTPRWLKEAREILHENFTQHLSLSEIGGLVGVHPVYLAEMFRQHYHCTIGEYTRCLRIEFASREISQTDASLAEIGLAAGFSHQAHFSRTFKRLTGLTPAEFRANSRRKT